MALTGEGCGSMVKGCGRVIMMMMMSGFEFCRRMAKLGRLCADY